MYYVRFCVAPGPRAKLTLAPSDFPGNELPCIPVWLLWLPHLSKFVDLPAARAAHRARLAAAEAIAWRLRGAFAHRLRLAYGGKQASSQGYLPIALRQNETRRRLGPPLIADPLEDWRNTCARQELMNHADRAPDPRRAVPLAGEAGQGGSGGSSVSGGSGVSGVSGVSCVSCVSGVSGLSCGAGATEQPRG